ncbi:unnamed protein product [Chironomus riparius]|uniref:Peptidase S1 domain-containing protein n=1 Tax=Chironomus riparius TaxID=315576 RepID=A0A9N9RT50_9DIPT|nr:unnamed protein product [Chironomus riparius]
MGLKKLIFVLCAFICYAGASEIAPLIVNGTDATIEEFPFLASLRFNNSHTCGSTIINEIWILTAAHCVVGRIGKTDLFSVHVESKYLYPSNPNVVFAETIYPHQGYNASNQYINDIALIKLKEPLKIQLFDWKVKLAMRGAYYKTGTPAVLAGWGYNESGGVAQTTLQKVNLQIYTASDCDEIHNSKVHASNICGGVEGGYQGQCSGDSGGPLLVRGVQVGIVSWSVKPCTVPPYPGVYASVAHFTDWIEETVGFNMGLNVFLSA